MVYMILYYVELLHTVFSEIALSIFIQRNCSQLLTLDVFIITHY